MSVQSSVQSERNRRHSIAGSSVRDDESLASSPAVPSYMAPTRSAKAKSKLSSPLGISENGAVDHKGNSSSPASAKKRLSFSPSPAKPRRHSGPPKVGGPTWTVRLGRRDSTTASRSQANTDLPGPDSDLARLISSFGNKNLTPRDMVALSGQAQCSSSRTRIYSNGTNIDAGFATTRRRTCPQIGGDGNLAPLDLVTPNSFDNNYYRNLVQRRGLLQSDQVLLSGGSTDSIVTEYSTNPRTFATDFTSAMIKMGEIAPVTGQSGIIRRICSAIN